jgi:hypothetical protein
VFSTRQHVGDVRVLLTARAMPLFVRKWSSTVSLEAPSHDLPPALERVDGGPTVYRRWFFLFLLPTFLSLPVKVHVCPFFQFHSLCFLLFIFIFDPFRKALYVFNSVLKLQFVIYCFHRFGPYPFDLSFLSLDLFLKFY